MVSSAERRAEQAQTGALGFFRSRSSSKRQTRPKRGQNASERSATRPQCPDETSQRGEEASARSASTKYGAATSAGCPLRATAPGFPRGAGNRAATLEPKLHVIILGEEVKVAARLLHCVEPRGRWRGGGSLQKSLRHTWSLQIERWLLRLAGSSRPGTEDASHFSRMRFLRFWALFGAWRTIDFEKTRESSSLALARLSRHC